MGSPILCTYPDLDGRHELRFDLPEDALALHDVAQLRAA